LLFLPFFDTKTMILWGEAMPLPRQSFAATESIAERAVFRSCRDLLFEPDRAGGFIRKFVGTALIAVSAVTFDPLPSDRKTRVQLDQLRPQFAVLQSGPASVSPALAPPTKDECSHSIDQVLGV
jgi:hypothetical protein